MLVQNQFSSGKRPCQIFYHGCVKSVQSLYWCFAFFSSDVNECAVAETNRCDPENQLCVNAQGNYTCKCKPGYKLIPQSGKCVGK